MGAVTTGARMAHAQLAALEAAGTLDGRLRPEILNGELVIRGFPQARHEDAVNVLMDHLRAWVRRHGGRVYAGLGIQIGPHQLGPDVAFIGPDRVGELDADGFRVPPDLVAEVTSPGTRSLDLNEKREIYRDVGVDEYWVVDLARDLVVVHHRDPGGAYRPVEVSGGTLTPRCAPGLTVPLDELLAEGDAPGG